MNEEQVPTVDATVTEVIPTPVEPVEAPGVTPEVTPPVVVKPELVNNVPQAPQPSLQDHISIAITSYARYVPIVVPVLLVAIQALVDNGVFNPSATTLAAVNVILGAVGLHALHVRTK